MVEQVETTLGENVARLRRARGISQTQLAKACQVTRSTISKIENGHGNPELATLSAIADALKVPTADLLISPKDKHHADPQKSQPASDRRLVEHWDPDNVVGLVMALSKILFVCPRMFRRHEIKNQRHILAKCGSYKECADTVNAIFYGTAMDAAYLLAAKPTRHFHRWCTNIAERSEELLVSMGYPILPLERPSAILQDYTSRIAPPTWQLLKYLKLKITIDTRNNDENVLAQNVIVFELKKKITDTHLMIPEILKSIHVLRLAGRALPNEISIQAKNLSFSKSIQKALFFNICSAYFHVYRVAPVMTDRNRRPFGHATGWAKLVLKLGTCRLARAIRLGRLNEARGNPWLDHLSSGLADAAQLKRHTIARRLEQAWRDVQAADRGDPGLLPIRAAGFLTRSSQDCAN